MAPKALHTVSAAWLVGFSRLLEQCHGSFCILMQTAFLCRVSLLSAGGTWPLRGGLEPSAGNCRGHLLPKGATPSPSDFRSVGLGRLFSTQGTGLNVGSQDPTVIPIVVGMTKNSSCLNKG